MAAVNPIPRGLRTLTPSLTVGECAKAIDFYVRALGATELSRTVAPDGSSIWHAELRVGDSVLFLNDEMPGSPVHPPSRDNPASVGMWLYVSDCDGAYARAVEMGAKSFMAPGEMFWGDRMATVIDPFGYLWTFATRVKEVSEEEMQRGADEFARRMKA